MEYAVEGNAKARKFLDTLMPSMISQLGLTNSRKAVLVKVENEFDMEGATLNMELADCFLVIIKKPKRLSKTSLLNMATTLAHEMVHVKQLAKGQMRFLPNSARMWMGKRYSNKVAYLDQPWEQEAFAKQELVVRRAIEI